MRGFRATIVTLFCVAVACCQAVTFQFPSGPPGSPMPNYYSGTNARASASATNGFFTHAYLYLVGNGEETLVSEFHADAEQLPLSVSLKCMFDSRHYPPGTAVTTKLLVYQLLDPIPYVGISSAVYTRNKAIL